MITGGNIHGDGGGIRNSGTLILNGGTITGNTASDSGGGVRNYGTLTVNGGAITGNTASVYHGGGIYNDGTLNLFGGEITGNHAGMQGGGVLNNDTLNVSGAPVVSGNTAATRGDNIYLRSSNGVMSVTGQITEGASLYVTSADDDAVITSGYGSHNTEHPAVYFHSSDADYGIAAQSGEVLFARNVVNDVPYVNRSWNGTEVVEEAASVHEARRLSPDFGTDNSWELPSGWILLDGSRTFNDRLYAQGNTNIILADGAQMDVRGIYIPSGFTLSIYGQAGNTGRLYSHPNGGGAAIGGISGFDNGSIAIYGGMIEAEGDSHCAGIGSNDGKVSGEITISGGTIHTWHRDGAGIGAGRNSDGGTITIYGGIITATGKDSSAGIGGGDPDGSREDFSRIYIHGGTVTATGGPGSGAGIGCGADGAGSTVTISGGTIRALSSSNIFGISNGRNSRGDSTVILDYTDATRDTISITSAGYAGIVDIRKAFTDHKGYITAGSYHNPRDWSGKTLFAADISEASYRRLDGTDQTQVCKTIIPEINSWDSGWYVLRNNVEMSRPIVLTNSSVNLVLMDGCTLIVSNVAVKDSSSLTIWGQAAGTGKLNATGGEGYAAGIGGYWSPCGSITINGGTVYARGGERDDYYGHGSAGIGGCLLYHSGSLTINGGDVTAIGGVGAAGIGGAYDYDGGTVTINGGTVRAVGGTGAAAIGSGANSEHAAVHITGGSITATADFAAIGSAPDSDVCAVSLNWTENSRAGMSIQLQGGQYGLAGSVAFENTFVDTADGTVYGVDTIGDGQLSCSALEPCTVCGVTFLPGHDGPDAAMVAVTVACGSKWPLPACGFTGPEGSSFACWQVAIGSAEPVQLQPGREITVSAETVLTAVWVSNVFSGADFTAPLGTLAIEANAFEGIAATAVRIPDGCASIGDYAFRDCGHLTQIRIPADCQLGADVFDGCGMVLVYSAAGSDAERYCQSHDNCVFVAEGQD